ncbi:methyltransferase family protein [Desulfallas thermosapovorans]|uniref:Protein-S-isoprenylcysteine O-methyltransferase Ste14 n=1 Tax=Desulfallas thermosapovorans DSM 6562 TaxID=1121431 RepID=A0A5S4ZVJ0_9FIRM|nr:isoprenylcysteine carboxylmethyltransferase family protein [Desulfallas thermosapovorans]TYO96231.1 protein-S-isoprenylcysteine O-methyltransferase Ste14 [Desulfallas thermosapovorans DSM 6562]
MKYLPLAVLWVAWATIHSIMISHRFTDWTKNKLGNRYRYYRLIFNVLALASFFPILFYSKMLDSTYVIRFSPPWNILQYALLALSLIIFVWSFRQFDFLEFLGIRQVMSKGANYKEPSTLIETGPYRFVRHPMYFGVLIFIWSLNATMADIITNIVLSIYIITGCLLEEKKLIAELGIAYIDYKKRVPMLIPFIKMK